MAARSAGPWHKRGCLVVAAFAVMASGCGDADSNEAAATTTRTQPSAPAVAELVADPDELRRFDVEGLEVHVRAATIELPDRATAVRLEQNYVLDNGDGPELCDGVLDSNPPRCGGPIINGFTFSDTAETMSGVTWDVRLLDVSWPPVSGAVTLIGDRPDEWRPLDVRPTLEPGNFTTEELEAAQTTLHEGLRGSDIDISSAPRHGRLIVTTGVADADTVRRIGALLDDPSIAVIHGHAVILSGELDPDDP